MMARCRTSSASRVVATATKSEQDVLACKGRVEKSRRKRGRKRESESGREREREQCWAGTEQAFNQSPRLTVTQISIKNKSHVCCDLFARWAGPQSSQGLAEGKGGQGGEGGKRMPTHQETSWPLH